MKGGITSPYALDTRGWATAGAKGVAEDAVTARAVSDHIDSGGGAWCSAACRGDWRAIAEARRPGRFLGKNKTAQNRRTAGKTKPLTGAP